MRRADKVVVCALHPQADRGTCTSEINPLAFIDKFLTDLVARARR
jgi:hypothetical protein